MFNNPHRGGPSAAQRRTEIDAGRPSRNSSSRWWLVGQKGLGGFGVLGFRVSNVYL